MQALFYNVENNKVRCRLCPHHCLIGEGQTGLCRVRKNEQGVLVAENYGRLSSVHLDPIEKKPLYHFYPGRQILSVGSVGCNMRCAFCQNCEISQVGVHEFPWFKDVPVEQLVARAKSINENLGIAFTYNEPTIFYEYMLDVAREAHHQGLKCVMVTNGYIEAEPMETILPFIDAFNVDLKAFTDSFYRKQTHAHLAPVKETLMRIRQAEKHLEITFLVIPGLNDSVEEFDAMTDWISNNLGQQTIFHLSKYFPQYHMARPETPDATLLKLHELACRKLSYVYLGNVWSRLPGHNTECSNCKAVVIKRLGYDVETPGITADGSCVHCENKVVER
ncbi:MAG: AmmeMemoRadiSam system radical SAM enzyme [Bacteroidota bacterium]|nr:AmmeMemoRadiSam system radical SAM enzyme [Bacteroidota bacterium]